MIKILVVTWHILYFQTQCLPVQCPECAQVYATDFGWARAFPMTSRSEAHETLSLLFARDGVLPDCVCDNTKDMIQGKLYQKLKDAACH